MIPNQRDPVTHTVRYIEPPMTSPAAHEAAPQRQIFGSQLARQLLCPTWFPRRLHEGDKAFRVGARLGTIKLEELEKASPAVGGNVLRFVRTFEQYIEEI
jgi:hypothetical protein